MKLKIISLNIWHGAFLPKVIDFLDTQNADIILLQEVYNSKDQRLVEKYRSFSILRAAFNRHESDYAQAYLEDFQGNLIPHGNAVFSKYKITATANTFLSDSTLESYVDKREHWEILPSNLQNVEIQVDGKKANIFNIHGVWDLDGESLSDHRRVMFQRTVDAIKDKENIILAGDTNAKPINPGFQLIESKLKPVFEQSIKTTFNMRHKENPGYATAPVDLMFVSPEIRVLTKEIPNVDVSDHLPLVVELELPN